MQRGINTFGWRRSKNETEETCYKNINRDHKPNELNKPFYIEHFFLLLSENNSRQIAEKLEAKGFIVEINDENDVVAKHEAPLNTDEFRQRTRAFDELARQFYGTYDGWEAYHILKDN